MPQTADNVLDHAAAVPASREYKEMLEAKRKNFRKRAARGGDRPDPRMDQDGRIPEKNFAREALCINPAKACQPLGAVFAAAGFEKTLPFVHGSQGCVAYYRSHLSRHFKEPTSASPPR